MWPRTPPPPTRISPLTPIPARVSDPGGQENERPSEGSGEEGGNGDDKGGGEGAAAGAARPSGGQVGREERCSLTPAGMTAFV